MQLELVSVKTSDGVRLDGTLARPAAGTTSPFGVDAVILHHGFSANFYGPGFFGEMQEALANAGVAALRVNNRGHDLVYNSAIGRLGSSFETMEDCRLDWQAWLDFATELGYRSIVVWGHSLGAVKTAYVMATESDTRVAGAIVSSPPRFSHSYVASMERGDAWLKAAADAQALVDAGRGQELMAVTEPLNTLMAPATIADKYGPAERYNVLDLLPRSGVPVLVTLGGDEGTGPEKADWTAFGHLDAQLTELASKHPHVEYHNVPGANHQYFGKTEELWAVARGWLLQLPVETAAG